MASRILQGSLVVDCVGLPNVVPDECDTVVAAIRAAYPREAGSASRMLVSDRCPPLTLCEGPWMYDLVAMLVLRDPSAAPVALHILGHVGQAFEVEPWTSPLPAHVEDVLGLP